MAITVTYERQIRFKFALFFHFVDSFFKFNFLNFKGFLHDLERQNNEESQIALITLTCLISKTMQVIKSLQICTFKSILFICLFLFPVGRIFLQFVSYRTKFFPLRPCSSALHAFHFTNTTLSRHSRSPFTSSFT